MTCHLSNHTIWNYSYRFTFSFGYSASGTGDDFVAYFTPSSGTIWLSGHHAEGDMTGGGTRVDVLRDNFQRLNWGKIVVYQNS
jgi:hypothetical protein